MTKVVDSSGEPSALKACSTCKKVKPLDAFNRRSTAKDGRQWACRDCNREYHLLNWDRHMDRIRARKASLRRLNREQIWAYLCAHPCVDCGLADPVVLEFDHLGDKKGDVGRMRYHYEWKTVLAEIRKCEVVCANCHRRRTYQRAGSWRTKGDEWAAWGSNPAPED